jgi:hypothetical protein
MAAWLWRRPAALCLHPFLTRRAHDLDLATPQCSSSAAPPAPARSPGPAARRVTQLPVLQVDEGLGRPCTAGFWNSRIKTQLVQPAAPRPERFDLTSHTGG